MSDQIGFIRITDGMIINVETNDDGTVQVSGSAKLTPAQAERYAELLKSAATVSTSSKAKRLEARVEKYQRHQRTPRPPKPTVKKEPEVEIAAAPSTTTREEQLRDIMGRKPESVSRQSRRIKARIATMPDGQKAKPTVKANGIEINFAAGTVAFRGKTAELPPTCLDIVALLAPIMPNILPTENIIQKVWGIKENGSTLLHVRITDIRKTLADIGINVGNVRGFGYLLQPLEEENVDAGPIPLSAGA